MISIMIDKAAIKTLLNQAKDSTIQEYLRLELTKSNKIMRTHLLKSKEESSLNYMQPVFAGGLPGNIYKYVINTAFNVMSTPIIFIVGRFIYFLAPTIHYI